MNRRVAWLAAAAVVLGGVVLFDNLGLARLFARAPGPAEIRGGAAAAENVKVNPLQGLDPQSFAMIMNRPLFNPGRAPRPPEPVAPPQPAVEAPVEQAPPPPVGPGAGDYKLLGVAAGPNGSTAAIKISASGEVVYLRPGQAIDSWSIIDIGPRSVKIGTPDNAVSFGLFEDVGAASQAPMDAPPSDAMSVSEQPDGMTPLPSPGAPPPGMLPPPRRDAAPPSLNTE